MNLYKSWGFKDSPFKTTSLGADEIGNSLLVGRDRELEKLSRKILTGPKMATVEGLNGVGKTSLVNVALYKLYKKHINGHSGPLFIPCRRNFQLAVDKDAKTFISEVLCEVAQTLIEKANELKISQSGISTDAIDRWLNSPQLSSNQVGGMGFSYGVTSEQNTTSGFEHSGFKKQIQDWLSSLFPNQQIGSVVCVIDNLELLQTSDAVKRSLETLRDELLTMKGLTWILCGSLGIVFGALGSPRLDGYLQRPIEVTELQDSYAVDIFRSRMDYFKSSSEFYMPLTEEKFVKLYDVLNRNLRSVISYSDDFCSWISDRELPETDDEKNQAFEAWLCDISDEAYRGFKTEIRPRAEKVFEQCIEIFDGIFSPSDCEELGFKTIPALRPHIKSLENVGVLVSVKDQNEGDKRRKSIQVTPKGWLAYEGMKRVKTKSTSNTK